MTGEEELEDTMPTGLDQLQYVIGNLWDEFGSTESPLLGLTINLGLTAIGVLVYSQTTGVVAFLGAVWAILHVLAIGKWVIGL